jgi:SpoVK/Ycf46/Vps4 family AAA+-type ATPase
VHSRGKKLAPGVTFERIARATAGFTGADIMNLMNQAAIQTVREVSMLWGASWPSRAYYQNKLMADPTLAIGIKQEVQRRMCCNDIVTSVSNRSEDHGTLKTMGLMEYLKSGARCTIASKHVML